jgi:hypothetical protein
MQWVVEKGFCLNHGLLYFLEFFYSYLSVVGCWSVVSGTCLLLVVGCRLSNADCRLSDVVVGGCCWFSIFFIDGAHLRFLGRKMGEPLLQEEERCGVLSARFILIRFCREEQPSLYKKLAVFPSPAGMSLTKLSLPGKN